MVKRKVYLGLLTSIKYSRKVENSKYHNKKVVLWYRFFIKKMMCYEDRLFENELIYQKTYTTHV